MAKKANIEHHTKEELDKEKVRHEIRNLRRGWVQPVSSIIGIFVLLFTTVSTNVSSYFKIKKIENKEIQVSKELKDTERVFHKVEDSLKMLDKSVMSDEVKFAQAMNEQEDIDLAKLKTKDEVIGYYRHKLDSLTKLIIEFNSISKEVGIKKDTNTAEERKAMIKNLKL